VVRQADPLGSQKGTVTMGRVLRRGAILAGLATVGLVGVNAPAALAAAPTFEQFQGSFTDVDSQTCGFPITINENFTSDVQFFYDQQGNLIRSLAHIKLRGTDSANGISLPDTADFTHTFDFTTGINGDLGVTTHVIIPNGGTVLTEAGRVLSDEQGNLLFVAGNHQAISGDVSAYCAALAG
jgi:hypothetical protein